MQRSNAFNFSAFSVAIRKLKFCSNTECFAKQFRHLLDTYPFQFVLHCSQFASSPWLIASSPEFLLQGPHQVHSVYFEFNKVSLTRISDPKEENKIPNGQQLWKHVQIRLNLVQHYLCHCTLPTPCCIGHLVTPHRPWPAHIGIHRPQKKTLESRKINVACFKKHQH